MVAFNDNFDSYTTGETLDQQTDWETLLVTAATKAQVVTDQFGGGGKSIRLDQPDGADAIIRGVAYVYNTGTDKQPATADLRLKASVKYTADAQNQECLVFGRSIRADAVDDTDLVGTKDLVNSYCGGIHRGTESIPYLVIARTSPTGDGTRMLLATKALAGADITGGGTIQLEIIGNILRLYWKQGSFAYDFSSDSPVLVAYDFGVAEEKIGGWGFLWRGANSIYIDDYDAQDLAVVQPGAPVPVAATFPGSASHVPVQLQISFTHSIPGRTHVATRWQVDSVGGAFNPATIHDVVDTVNLLTKIVYLPVTDSFRYRAAAKDEDGNWSAWSSIIELTVPGSAGSSPFPMPVLAYPAASLPIPDQGFTDSYAFKTTKSFTDTGADRSRAMWGNGRRLFTISYTYLQEAEKVILRDFWLQTKGGHLPFKFIHPLESTEHAVKFLDDSMDFEAWFGVVYKVGLRLIETWGPTQSNIYGI